MAISKRLTLTCAQLLEGEKYAERKGAAYGLAGVVKGMGILSLKQHNIVGILTVGWANFCLVLSPTRLLRRHLIRCISLRCRSDCGNRK